MVETTKPILKWYFTRDLGVQVENVTTENIREGKELMELGLECLKHFYTILGNPQPTAAPAPAAAPVQTQTTAPNAPKPFKPLVKSAELCPNCGKNLVVRNRKKDGVAFLSCPTKNPDGTYCGFAKDLA